jgi:hypothetical protein
VSNNTFGISLSCIKAERLLYLLQVLFNRMSGFESSGSIETAASAIVFPSVYKCNHPISGYLVLQLVVRFSISISSKCPATLLH